MSRPMTGYYKEKLKQGLEYQDFVMMNLHKAGIVLQNIQSSKYQLKRENLLGLEIKFDDQMGNTGNIYFETHEKTNAENENWIPSGILRDDECWLYGIGNYENFYIFSKKRLVAVYERVARGDRVLSAKLLGPNQTKTAKGMLIPVEQAMVIIERHVDLKNCDYKPHVVEFDATDTFFDVESRLMKKIDMYHENIMSEISKLHKAVNKKSNGHRDGGLYQPGGDFSVSNHLPF